jgi:hypothetical protein
MAEKERLVAVISPWDKLPNLVKKSFRMESLPAEKKVMVWRDDLQTEQALSDELRKVGIMSAEIQQKPITDWKATE